MSTTPETGAISRNSRRPLSRDGPAKAGPFLHQLLVACFYAHAVPAPFAKPKDNGESLQSMAFGPRRIREVLAPPEASQRLWNGKVMTLIVFVQVTAPSTSALACRAPGCRRRRGTRADAIALARLLIEYELGEGLLHFS